MSPETAAHEDENVCGAAIIFGDDHGDNPATFICKLPNGHAGSHCEFGTKGGQSWNLVFTGDDRRTCRICGKLFPDSFMSICVGCDQYVCKPCMNMEKVWKSYCPECEKEGKRNEGAEREN